MNTLKTGENDAKKVFKELGTCSRTFFHLLNREFGHNQEPEECAADPLAGGIAMKGHQCGMLWGATMAVGAEAYRRTGDLDRSIGLAIKATQHLVKSFSDRTGTVNCREITKTDFTKRFQMWIFMLFRSKKCFKMAEQWAPEAIDAAMEGLSRESYEMPEHGMSCATEVARKMGANEEQMAMVAGFAGGMGLQGHGCGALSAALWMKALEWVKENPGKSPFFESDPSATINMFLEATGSQMLCPAICGRRFETVEEHTEFVQNGGCQHLIELLGNG